MPRAPRPKRVKFKAKDQIVRQGHKATHAFLITKGLVRVYLEKNNRIVTLAELGSGAIFGESALFGGYTYGANVMAIEPTEITIISPETFERKVEKCDAMLRAIILSLIERQRKTNEKLLKSETQEFMDIGFS